MSTGCTSCGASFFGGGIDDMSGGKKGQKLEADTRKDLYAKARKYNIKGRSKMTKYELVVAVRSEQRKIGDSIARKTRKSKKPSASK